MRLLYSLIFIILIKFTFAQSIQSPDLFLGYPLGSQYTLHYKIVDYFKRTTDAAPQKIKLESYGKTYEGRELFIAIASTNENMQRIEEIRKNNLRLAGVLNDQPGDVNMPTIVWLSYNVHGNETSSSEVSMKLLFEIANNQNSDLNNWLKNTVVIIDPCLNPDGRDRYINWFNQMVGVHANSYPNAREHFEPWPGGRTNHYNFDLNRDWAWQSQIETQGRIKLYNQWMPEIHCDYHEQNVNSPYYFAPAAEPFHEVITPWQRSFQTTIGKNHAKYFDQNGWLYFTKEVFDLFYPSYGDTYPLYNGSIGMTYEQAGNTSAGLSVENGSDTLTLYDRIQHHFTTSMSTIEIAATQSKKINDEFKNYFEKLKKDGIGEYKSFLLKSENQNKLITFLDLLTKNKIDFGYAKEGVSVKGFHYLNGKTESYTTTSNDIIINTFQSKGALVKVLFEPASKLSDSVTYDITAWALPYAYGVDAYALKEKILPNTNQIKEESNSSSKWDYGYLIEYKSFQDGKLLAALLNNKVKVHFTEKDFQYDGKQYNKGTLIVLKKENENIIKNEKILTLFNQYTSSFSAIQSGFMESGIDMGSEKVHLIKAPKVALITGASVNASASGEVWHLFDQQLKYPITLINANDLDGINLKNIDVIIVPDGEFKLLADKESSLKKWVQNGGKIIAIENAVAQMASGDWGIKLKTENVAESKLDGYEKIKRYEDRERQSVTKNIPGAIYKLALDNSHPLGFGYSNTYFTLKMNANLIEFLKDGWNVGVIKNDEQISGFIGAETKSKIKDGALIAVQELEKGTAVYFVDNPIFRSFWENGKLLLTNAVFLVGQ